MFAIIKVEVEGIKTKEEALQQVIEAYNRGDLKIEEAVELVEE